MEKNINNLNDFAESGIDLVKHREVLEALSRLGVDPKSVKPTLAAREMAVGKYEGAGIYIAVGSAASQVVSTFGGTAIISVEPMEHTSSLEDALQIRADAERYFTRHFPGRYLNNVAPASAPQGSTVFVVFAERS
ncbi:hypothetical protein [Capsulimonas corticalis]|nr:hypothetical protein [Capsulimonas corticalis]